MKWIAFVGLITLNLFLPTPTPAAEKIMLNYSIFHGSISVKDLRHLSETGEATLALKTYLKLANKNPESLQNALNQTVNINGVTLSKVLNSFVGNMILDQITEVIHTPSRRASREALRGALIQSAIDDNQVQVIEVLENYPTSELHVDGNRLMEIYGQIKGIADKIPSISL